MLAFCKRGRPECTGKKPLKAENQKPRPAGRVGSVIEPRPHRLKASAPATGLTLHLMLERLRVNVMFCPYSFCETFFFISSFERVSASRWIGRYLDISVKKLEKGGFNRPQIYIAKIARLFKVLVISPVSNK